MHALTAREAWRWRAVDQDLLACMRIAALIEPYVNVFLLLNWVYFYFCITPEFAYIITTDIRMSRQKLTHQRSFTSLFVIFYFHWRK